MPNGRNIKTMLQIVEMARAQQRPYIEMAIHSSELMPGGSPTFVTEASVEKLYADLEAVISAATTTFTGSTLSAYRERFVAMQSR
jgi:coenzyme F420-reducing hydrogenase alpha subunit